MNAYQINSPIKHKGRTVKSGLVWLPDAEAQELLQLGHLTGPMAVQGESVASTEGTDGALVGSTVVESGVSSPAVVSVSDQQASQESPVNADSTTVPSPASAPVESAKAPTEASKSAPAKKAAVKKTAVKTGKAIR